MPDEPRPSTREWADHLAADLREGTEVDRRIKQLEAERDAAYAKHGPDCHTTLRNWELVNAEADRDAYKGITIADGETIIALTARITATEEMLIDAGKIIEAAREHNRTASASSLDMLDGALRRFDARYAKEYGVS